MQVCDRWRPMEVLDDPNGDNASNGEETREYMRRLADSVRLSYDRIGDSKNLMAFFDDNAFIWQNDEQCVYCCRLKDERHIISIQRLSLTNSPLFNVDDLLFSTTGRYLALYGTRGINVVELPRKWGINGAYERGKSTLLTRSWSIAERFFVCNQKVSLLCSRWHPSSQHENHIVILTNDNCLRIYDIHDEQTEFQIINLSLDASSSLHNGVSLYALSLGENAVSFDFGSAISKCYDVDPSTITSPDECLWPLYVLRGNGDVLLLYSNLKYSYVSNCIIGPLTMRPPAEDNYGVDACSLICLDCDPTLIVIATTSGIIHHCIALQLDDQIDTVDKSLLPEPTLFVYESIELSLSLVSSSEMQDSSCAIRLQKDPIIATRYYCSHTCGVHAISVPFVTQLKSKDEHNFREEESIVEYLICTKPFGCEQDSTSHSTPVGLAMCVLNGYTSLLVLLNSGELIGQRLTPAYISHILDESGGDSMAPNDSLPLLTIPRVNFDEHIKQILKRNASVPLIKSNDGPANQSQQMLELLLTTTEVLRKEYTQRFETASVTIERRIKALIADKQIQLKELEKCLNEKESLLTSLISMAEKYDSARLTQELLSNKMDSILGSLQYQQPILSDAEIALRDELKLISNRLSSHRVKLEQIKVKCKYQEDQIAKSETIAADAKQVVNSHSSPSLNQIKGIKQMLNNENESIVELKQLLNEIKNYD